MRILQDWYEDMEANAASFEYLNEVQERPRVVATVDDWKAATRVPATYIREDLAEIERRYWAMLESRVRALAVELSDIRQEYRWSMLEFGILSQAEVRVLYAWFKEKQKRNKEHR